MRIEIATRANVHVSVLKNNFGHITENRYAGLWLTKKDTCNNTDLHYPGVCRNGANSGKTYVITYADVKVLPMVIGRVRWSTVAIKRATSTSIYYTLENIKIITGKTEAELDGMEALNSTNNMVITTVAKLMNTLPSSIAMAAIISGSSVFDKMIEELKEKDILELLNRGLAW